MSLDFEYSPCLSRSLAILHRTDYSLPRVHILLVVDFVRLGLLFSLPNLNMHAFHSHYSCANY